VTHSLRTAANLPVAQRRPY